MRRLRALVIFAIVVGALVAMFLRRPLPSAEGELPRLTYVTTAHQLGVVGYRDPAGAISPDGTRVAYSEGRNVRIIPTGGGAPQTLAAGDGQIRNLTWVTDQRLVAEETGTSTRWWEYSPVTGQRIPLWSGANNFMQIAWSHDGKSAAAIVNGKDGPELRQISAGGSLADPSFAPVPVPNAILDLI